MMKSSITLAHLGGTAVKIHVTLWLAIAWYAWEGWRLAGALGVGYQLLLLTLLLLSILLHEFGHIRAARRFGLPTPDVFLTPIGGVARISRMPDTPRQEIIVALAGPSVSLGIAVGLFSGILVTEGAVGLLPGGATGFSLLAAVAWVNAGLLIFNLIPAFPMDGGRVLRALLTKRLGLVRGTRIAARTGQIIAVGFAVAGFFSSPMLLLIAAFVIFAAEAEYRQIRQIESARAGQSAGLVDIDLPWYDPSLRLSDIADTVPHAQHSIWPLVAPSGRYFGALTTDELVDAIASRTPNAQLADLLSAPDPTTLIHASRGKDAAVRQLLDSGRSALPVLDDEEKFVGMLTRDRVTDAMLSGRLHVEE